MNNTYRNALIAELQSKHPYTPFSSEESKQMMHILGHAECSELCEISPTTHSLSCMTHWMEGIVHCDEYLSSSHSLNTSFKHRDSTGGSRGARHGRSEEQRAYY